MASNVKNPPIFNDDTNYEIWEKSLKVWQLVTDLKPEKQGPALILAISGKAQEIVLELSLDEIKAADGVETILTKLRTIYRKDSVDTAYEAFERFIYFTRESSMKMTEYINEFERR